MTDYTTEVIAKYLKDNNLDAPEDDGIIECIEYWDWIDEVCEINEINKFVRNYVNFEKMLIQSHLLPLITSGLLEILDFENYTTISI